MISPTLLLFFLALGCVLSQPHAPTTITNNSTTTTTRPTTQVSTSLSRQDGTTTTTDNKDTVNLEDLHTSIVINQLAILKYIKDTSAKFDGQESVSVLHDEVRRLQTNLASMHGDIVATLRGIAATGNLPLPPQSTPSININCPDNESHKMQLQIVELKELMLQLQAQNNQSQEIKQELLELKEIIVEFNQSIATQKNDYCIGEGKLYVNNNCSISVCQRNALLPYQGSTAPNVDFSDLLDKYCVHLERNLKTWEEARANCISLGGDLFVAGDYEGAREYLKKKDESDEGLFYWPWVGVKGKSWLDGQQVNDSEWDYESPGTNNDSCSFLHGRGLQDSSACSSSYSSLCVKGTNYQSSQLDQVTEDRQCTVEGEFYVNDNCSISVCQHNVLLPYQGSTAPNVDFSDLLDKDCVHLERNHKTWEEARANCISLGGDLFVAGDYEGAREYLKKEDESDEGLYYWPWVGVKGKSWLDGQQVTDSEWDDDSPGTNNDSCSFLHGRGLEDSSACSSSYSSLCVKGTNYQSSQLDQVTEDRQCTVEGEFYVNDNCSISVCQHNVLLPYQGSTAPNVDFSDLLDKDCVHLERNHTTWEEARANCISLGGDLFVAGDYEGAREYLKKDKSDKDPYYWPWVGVKGKSWLDGQQVTDSEWDDESPGTNNDSCSFLHWGGLQDLLECSNTYSSLCVKGTNYQSSQLDQVTEDRQCTVEGEFYVNDNCSISVCQHNVLFPYQGSTAPNVDFSDLLDKDCVHLERNHKTWEEARANCISLGGDLFVAGDYEGAREYLKKEDESDEGLYYWPWVGVKGKSWLDGQQVTDSEWDDDSPGTNNDSCSFLHGRGLEDSSACSSSYSSLCVKGTNYQSSQLDQVTEDRQCTVEGEFYVNDNCSISVCQHNVLFPYQGSTAPNVDFSDLLDKDCVHLERNHKTWEEARANCISLGGDLFVAGDYEGAREYLKKEDESDEGLYYWPWVGVKGKSWLDGQQVTDSEWDDDSPGTNDDSCSFLHGRGLEDSSACSSSYTSLCLKGSYHWYVIHTDTINFYYLNS
ncbi:hypothetical protein Pmani_015629 [Petrolisthes manimaculis]|uniref:C-type lectin domain-containing protein n=1 Tax=Petrolisthes manimaculis TaxID=1843537 RepID=A0AAE1U767_9EUCA|nr:hypothetical protein Pmani_015629 [Petrolisthes manimaculis]